MEPRNIKCRNCRIKSALVSSLNQAELALLEKGCSQVNFSKGELLFKENGPATYITYIRDGFVKLSKKGLGQKEYILGVYKKGAYIGLHNLNLSHHTNYFSAYALTDTNVCFIDIQSFNRLLQNNGTFASEVISYIFSDEMNYFERLINNVQQQLPGRVANALLYFQQKVYQTNPFSLNLTMAELASLIGSTRESVTRTIKEFHASGIITAKRSCIQVLDEARLEEIKQKG